jgi:uncharacterized Rossmann fold enzyme
MNFINWISFYEKISKEFNFIEEKEKKSSFYLNNILNSMRICPLKIIKNLIYDKEVLVFGAGPSLTRYLENNKNKLFDKTIISADGATSALLKYYVLPDIIVTDLDGKISDQILANSKGSIVIIHAHGDNINNIKKYAPLFNNKILGTTQIDPGLYSNLENFGGFTDGDRSIFLATHFKAKEIKLIGFDFNGKIGNFSNLELKNREKKLRKLKWCQFFIEELKKNNKISQLG